MQPGRLQGLAGLPERVDVLPNDLDTVQAFIDERAAGVG